MNAKKISLERLEKTDIKIKLNISKPVLDQIKYLCGKIPNLEWSGILFYEVEGSIKDPKNMVITTTDILPLDKGTSGFTNFSSNLTGDDNQVKVAQHWMKLGLDKKQGTIHSHNNMGVFLSGTDWSEVEDNAPNHNYYLFVVVNNKTEVLAKVAYMTKYTMQGISRDDNGNIYNPFGENVEKDLLIVYDCNVNIVSEEIKVTEEFLSNVEDIMKPKTITSTSTSGSRVFYSKDGWGSYEYTPPKVFSKKEVGVNHSKIARIAHELYTEDVVEDFIKYLIEDNTTVDCDDYEEVLEKYADFDIKPEELIRVIKRDFETLYKDFFKEYEEASLLKEYIIKWIITDLKSLKNVSSPKVKHYKYFTPLINFFNGLLTI